ncbi:receptor-type tyrosine-protein phosphatase N2 [Erethizon dorsatum]
MGPPLPPLLLPLLLLLLPPLALPAAPAPAPRGWQLPGRLGCLLEDGLCGATEACVNDGVFGRCQKFPALDTSRYEVSPMALQHLRVTWQALSRTGFTWQDDYAQRIMAQELAGLPRAHPQRTETSSPARTSQQNLDTERQYSLEDNVALAKTLQRYLPYLEALSHTTASSAHRRREREKLPAKDEAPFPENILTYVTRTSALTYPPMTRVQHPGAFPLRTLSRLQPDELSLKADSSVDRQHLMAALGAYTARRPPVLTREGDPGLRYILRNPSRAPKPLSALAAPQKWLSPPGDPQDPLSTGDGGDGGDGEGVMVKVVMMVVMMVVVVKVVMVMMVVMVKVVMKVVMMVVMSPLGHGAGHTLPSRFAVAPSLEAAPTCAPGAVSERGSLDKDNFCSPISCAPGWLCEGNYIPLLPRGPEALVRSLLKDLRRQQADVEHGAPAELEGVADVIAAAARQVGVAQVTERGRTTAQAPASVSREIPFRQVSHLSVRLGDLLQDHRSPLPPGGPPLERSFPTETKKSEEPVASLSSEEEDVGVENVKSQAYSKDLSEKPNAEPRAAGLGGLHSWDPGAPQEAQSPQAGARGPPGEGLQLEARPSDGEEPGYIVTGSDPLSPEKGKQLMDDVAHLLQVPPSIFEDIDVLGPAVTFKVSANVRNVTTADVAKATADHKNQLEETSGLRILQSGTGPSSRLKPLPHQREQEDSTKFIVLTFLSMACIVGVLLASGLIYCLRHSSHHKLKKKLSGLGGDASADATAAYQELCRQRMAVRPPDRPEGPHASRISSVSSQFSDGPMPSPSARSSTSSWSEEPVQSNMDISTGHMILAYMEDHLQNKNRLEKEWEALCAYQAEPSSSLTAQREENLAKNRCPAVLTYDHSRILLKAENSHGNSDYINASPIMDHDPRNPAYITTQGPLPATVADFWQMVWESGCAVIVMLTPLTENGVRQCHHYWPDEGSNLYHIYEVNLVSEHIWCEDFLVRSFYLKNLQTHETRTVTQFHFLSWYDQGVPSSTRSLLDFRRKVNKCYRGRSCPIIVHCSDGAGRSGTYILIDMVLNKMAKGAKEIDIAATLEHLRDQRPGMVQTKEQFEFALTAVAVEVNAILRALPQ